MKLYQFAISHSCAKVSIVLNEKGLNAEKPAIELSYLKTPEFQKISPTGKVPFLVDGDFGIPESQIIVDYLEEKYPKASMTHDSLKDRTEARLLCRLHDFNVSPAVAGVYVPLLDGRIAHAKLTDRDCVERVAKLHVELQKIEKIITPGPFLVGNHFSMADATFALTIWYAKHCGDQVNDPFDRKRYPKLSKWYAHIENRPSVAKVIAECIGANGIEILKAQAA